MKTERNLFISLSFVLLGFGVLMVHSASITSWPTEFERVYLSRHLRSLVIGLFAAIICAHLPARFWYRVAPVLFLGTVALLVVVLIPGVGREVNNARRWLRFGPLPLQPSELAKVALPLFLCMIMTRRRDWLRRWFAGTVPLIVPIVLIAALVLRQPDLGTALYLVATSGLALFLGGWPIRNFVLGTAAGIPACISLVALKPYQMQRITGFLAAWSDMNQAPYQLKQSLVTLGSGGLLGVGLGKGWQKLSFLPESNTDFVFAVIGEELGLVGTLGLLLLWAGWYVTGLRLLRSFDRASFVYVAGVTLLTQLVLQASVNIAVVTGLVPTKGIPHPLISYGGSSLVVSLIALGIIVSLSKARPGADDVVLQPGPAIEA